MILYSDKMKLLSSFLRVGWFNGLCRDLSVKVVYSWQGSCSVSIYMVGEHLFAVFLR